MSDFNRTHRGADFHQGCDADGFTRRFNHRVGVGVLERGAARDPIAERLAVGKRSVARHVGPDVVMAAHRFPQRGGVLGSELFHPSMTAFQHHRARTAGGSGINRRTDRQVGHAPRFFRSSRNRALSSAPGADSLSPSEPPSCAICFATRITLPQPTRARAPPTLMRRTPRAARSLTVSGLAPEDISTLTGFGATALTTAAICSRVLMPGE